MDRSTTNSAGQPVQQRAHDEEVGVRAAGHQRLLAVEHEAVPSTRVAVVAGRIASNSTVGSFSASAAAAPCRPRAPGAAGHAARRCPSGPPPWPRRPGASTATARPMSPWAERLGHQGGAITAVPVPRPRRATRARRAGRSPISCAAASRSAAGRLGLVRLGGRRTQHVGGEAPSPRRPAAARRRSGSGRTARPQCNSELQFGRAACWPAVTRIGPMPDAAPPPPLPPGGVVRPITRWGDAGDAPPQQPVTTYDEDLRRLAADMVATMYAADGVGLAACQIGVDLAMFVFDCPDESGAHVAGVVCNPVLTLPEGRDREPRRQRGGLPVAARRVRGVPSPRRRLGHRVRPRRRAGRPSAATGCWPGASSTRPTTSRAPCSATGSPTGCARRLQKAHDKAAPDFPEGWPAG